MAPLEVDDPSLSDIKIAAGSDISSAKLTSFLFQAYECATQWRINVGERNTQHLRLGEVRSIRGVQPRLQTTGIEIYKVPSIKSGGSEPRKQRGDIETTRRS